MTRWNWPPGGHGCRGHALVSGDPGTRPTLVANDVRSRLAGLGNADVFATLVSRGELSATDRLRLSFMFALDVSNPKFVSFPYTDGPPDEATWLTDRHVLLSNHSAGPG